MASGIVIVKQYERLVVLKWGRLAQIAPPGFRFLIPIIYTGRSVDLREQVVRVPTQKYITKDNVVVDMDFVLYYRVMADQAEKSVLEVADHHAAVRNLAVGELRSIVGNFTLGDALSERERMQSQLQVALDENTGRWGVSVRPRLTGLKERSKRLSSRLREDARPPFWKLKATSRPRCCGPRGSARPWSGFTRWPTPWM
jgi:regulator of protease activity HflC (stomatin/prohibitin superfamily)